MKLVKIQRVPNGLDTIRIGNKDYVIRFSAKHAQHIQDNINDPAHRISYAEIVNLLKESVVLSTQVGKKWLALGRFRKKVYETYFYLTKDRLDVITSYSSNKPPLLKLYQDHESNQ